MAETKKGIILKAISGFYYVSCDEKLYECRAKGAFRYEGVTPLVGDYAEIALNDDGETATVIDILPRKNDFTRPPIANIDKLFIVASTLSPSPNRLVIDKLITVCEYKNIEPIIVITKVDLKSAEELRQLYLDSGFKVILVSNVDDSDFSVIKNELRGAVSVFAGNTGVGKSSLINNLFSNLQLATDVISKKLGRGKHTTRHVELFRIDECDCYIADTPGFGSMELAQYQVIRKEELCHCFREFQPYINNCKYTGCSHTVEKGCAVLEALSQGKIRKERLECYTELYKQAKLIKEWEAFPTKK